MKKLTIILSALSMFAFAETNQYIGVDQNGRSCYADISVDENGEATVSLSADEFVGVTTKMDETASKTFVKKQKADFATTRIVETFKASVELKEGVPLSYSMDITYGTYSLKRNKRLGSLKRRGVGLYRTKLVGKKKSEIKCEFTTGF